MVDKKDERPRPYPLIDYTQFWNAARASPLAGRFTPKKYPSGGDEGKLMSAAEFHAKYIHNRPGNIYTDSGDNIEVPSPTTTATLASPISLHSPVSPVSDASTKRHGTESSLGGSTFRDDDVTTTSWYLYL
jgi:hypothetical protein